MSKRTDYSADEWEAIRRAPAEAVVAIEQASPSHFLGRRREAKAARRSLADVISQFEDLELMADLIAARETEGALIDGLRAGGEPMIDQSVATASAAWAALRTRASREEREAYASAVLRLAESVADASGEGEAGKVSMAEMLQLRRLGDALGRPDYEPPGERWARNMGVPPGM
jgi:hypothetical protein